MIQHLPQALAQLAFGFVIACIILVAFVLVREYLQLNKQPVEYMYEFDKAELRTYGWQYYEAYFDKIEEFRSDFA